MLLFSQRSIFAGCRRYRFFSSAKRYAPTIVGVSIDSFADNGDQVGFLKVDFDNGQSRRFHLEWLIDHDPKYIHPESLQRQLDSASLSCSISSTENVAEYGIGDRGKSLKLAVKGNDTGQIYHSAEFLYSNAYDMDKDVVSKVVVDLSAAKKKLESLKSWDSTFSPEKYSFNEFTSSQVLEDFKTNGLFILKDIPQTREELIQSNKFPQSENLLRKHYLDTYYNNLPTENLQEASVEPAIVTEFIMRHLFAAPRETHYGRMWDTAPKDENQVINDTAYTKDALHVHIDGCYWRDTPGFQVFHCTAQSNESSEEGSLEGCTRVCDGIAVMKKILEEYPKTFNFFATTKVKWMAKESGVFMEAAHLPFSFDSESSPEGSDVCFRYNTYDLGILNYLPFESVHSFYKHNRVLSGVMRSEEMMKRLKLEVGEMLVVNNHRVCHGRESFLGYRSMVGCYGGVDEWTSKARTLG